MGSSAWFSARDTDDGTIDAGEISEATLIAFEDNGKDLHDKNSMTADPFDSDFVCAVWDFLGDYVGLDHTGNTFTPFFIEGVSATDPSSGFFARLTP